MSLDISLKLADVADISTGRLLSGFEDEAGKLHDGRIKANGNIYEVKFLEGGTAEVRRNYQGWLVGWLRNKWCSKETTRAKALQEKINTILSQSNSAEYRILSGTHKQLLNLVKNSDKKTIEVANTEDFRQNGGSPITNSELRRAVKMAENSTVIRV